MKKLALGIVGFMILTVMFNSPQIVYSYDITTNLVARMDFNEGSGTTINIVNGSLKGGYGTINNLDTEPMEFYNSFNATADYSLSICGSAPDTQNYVSFADHDAWSFDKAGSPADNPFSFETYINSTNANAHGVWGKVNETYVNFEFDEPRVRFHLRDGDGTILYWYTTTYQLPDDTWTHLAITYNGNARTNSTAVTIYANGVSQTLTFVGTQANYGGLNNTAGEFRLGKNQEGSERFDGEFDEFRLWNKELSQSEVEELVSFEEDEWLEEEATTPAGETKIVTEEKDKYITVEKIPKYMYIGLMGFFTLGGAFIAIILLYGRDKIEV